MAHQSHGLSLRIFARCQPIFGRLAMPFARIDLAQGKSTEYRATVADVVYEGIVGILKAPDGDRFMVIVEHAPENFVYDPNFLDIKRSPGLIYIQVTSTVGNT